MTNQTIRQIDTDHLIHNLSVRPYDTYVEATRRQTYLMECKEAWNSKRQPRTERELNTLLRVVRAYHARSASLAY